MHIFTFILKCLFISPYLRHSTSLFFFFILFFFTFTIYVGSPICMFPRSESPPSSPAHLPLEDHGYKNKFTMHVKCATHHFKLISYKYFYYLPYLYGIGGVFSFSIWWRSGVKILHASLNSSLENNQVNYQNAIILHA